MTIATGVASDRQCSIPAAPSCVTVSKSPALFPTVKGSWPACHKAPESRWAAAVVGSLGSDSSGPHDTPADSSLTRPAPRIPLSGASLSQRCPLADAPLRSAPLVPTPPSPTDLRLLAQPPRPATLPGCLCGPPRAAFCAGS